MGVMQAAGQVGMLPGWDAPPLFRAEPCTWVFDPCGMVFPLLPNNTDVEYRYYTQCDWVGPGGTAAPRHGPSPMHGYMERMSTRQRGTL